MTLAVTYTLSNGQTSDASLWNTNYSDIVTWINNRDTSIAQWQNVYVNATAANPVNIVSTAATTELSIDNTAVDGDPIFTWKLSGSTKYTLGVDDSDSDFLKLGTTSDTTNVAMQIPSTGAAVYFATGSTSVPSIGFLADSGFDTGLYLRTTDSIGITCAGTTIIDFNATVIRSLVNFVPTVDNSVSCGATGDRWTALWAVNGTVQTSHTSTKTEIESVEEVDLKIPDTIKFLRPEDKHSSKQIGFAADDLPIECFAVIDEKGNRSSTDVYLSSVVGLLCGAVKKLDERLAAIEAK